MITLSRTESWPEALHTLVDARAAWPFAWGAHDCCAFAAAAVEAMTGTDPIADLRGYHDAASAQTLLDSLGGLEAAVTARLGEPIATPQARRGDVVMLDVSGISALGICLGDFAAVPGPRAIEWADRRFWRRAWRIG